LKFEVMSVKAGFKHRDIL